jgi:predicted metal-dependent hydrolase
LRDAKKVYRQWKSLAMKENRQFEKGLAHFNGREFFLAHEVWEELWLREPEPEKTFLQGLIQIAAAFHHYGRGNLRGTKSLLIAGTAKIGAFPTDHRGIALGALRDVTQRWIEMLDDRAFRPENLPQIDPVRWDRNTRSRKKASTGDVKPKKKRGR